MSGRLAALAAAGLCAGVFTVYAFVMGSLFAIRAGVTVELPWWVAIAAPVVLYAALAGTALPRASGAVRAWAFVALCGAHIVVAGVTAVLVAAVSEVSVAEALAAASLSFLPAPLLQVLAVPLMLWPLRALVRRQPRSTGARRIEAEFEWARPRGGTVPGWQGGRPLPGPARAAEPPAREPGGARANPPAVTGQRTSAFSSPPRTVSPAAPPAPATGAPAARGAFVLAAPLDQATAGAPPSAPAPSATSRGMSSSFAPPAADSAGGAVRAAVAAAPADEATARSAAPGASAPASKAPEGMGWSEPGAGPGEGGSPAVAKTDRAARPSKPEGETIPVPFDRVATALPADLLAWDPSRISAGLAEPGLILVPVAVVLPQLAEGFVAIEWAEVLLQFPAGAFRGDAADVASRLPDRRLPLPIDEIVQRLPQEIFATAGPAADLDALASYPLPFQPVDAAPPLPEAPPRVAAPEPAPAPRADAESDASPTEAREVAITVDHAPAADAPVVTAASDASPSDAGAVQVERESWGDAPAASHAAVADVPAEKREADASPAVAPIAEAASDVSPADAPAVTVERGPAWIDALEVPATGDARLPEPAAAKGHASLTLAAELALGPVPPMPEPIPAVAAAAPAAAAALADPPTAEADARPLTRLARILAPVGSLFGSEAECDGHTVFLFRPPAVDSEAVLAAAGPALAVLRSHASRLGQLTVRAERGALVLTSLAAPEDAALVAAAAPLDGSLALLEILSLRVAASPSAPALDAASEAGLEPISAGPAADLVAGGLTAFGALTPSVVRDPAGRVEVCVLHAPGEAIRELATVAHAVCCALAATDPGALGPVRDAVLRLPTGEGSGARRVAVRPVGGRPGHWIALAAPAGDARAGLVELEIARAAARVAR